MLETIQNRFQTVVLGLLVALLVASFVLTFGTPGQGGCTLNRDGGTFAARVYDTTITEGEFRAAYLVLGFAQEEPRQARTMRYRELTLSSLVERELLAHEAERMGLSADPRDVLRDIAQDGYLMISRPVDAPNTIRYPGPRIPVRFEDRDGRFSRTNMQNFILHRLRRTVAEFERWQVRERLAEMVRDQVSASVVVSPREVRDQYDRETNRVTLEYVRFTPTFYRNRVEQTEDAIREWMRNHTDDVDAEYERQRHRYTGLEEQRRARHILIRAGQNMSDEERAAARQRAEEILARARSGEDFAALAREFSEDTSNAGEGGDLGWNVRGRMVAPFDEAQFSTEPGQITDHVVETTFGYHVLKVEGRREGDVPEDEAKRELASQLFQRGRATEIAEEEARAALAFLTNDHSMQDLDASLAESSRADDAAPDAPRDSFAPQLRETRSFSRTEIPISGATNGGQLTRAAFELSEENPLPSEPLRLGDDWYVFRLKERAEATDEGFTDDVRDGIHDQLIRMRQIETLRVYVYQLREAAERSGALRISDTILDYGVEEDAEEEEAASLLLPARAVTSTES